jgi:hypothetical protein
MALTAPWVPTGIKIGVGITPCSVTMDPARADPSVASNVKKGAVWFMVDMLESQNYGTSPSFAVHDYPQYIVSARIDA